MHRRQNTLDSDGARHLETAIESRDQPRATQWRQKTQTWNDVSQDEKVTPDTVKEQPIWKEDNGLFITEFKCLHFHKLEAESLAPQLGCSHGNPLSVSYGKRFFFHSCFQLIVSYSHCDYTKLLEKSSPSNVIGKSSFIIQFLISCSSYLMLCFVDKIFFMIYFNLIRMFPSQHGDILQCIYLRLW